MTHPTDEDLLAYTTGVLPGGALEDVELHVDGCPACEAKVASLARQEVALRRVVAELGPRPVRPRWWRLWWALPAFAVASALVLLVPRTAPAPVYAARVTVQDGLRSAVGSEGSGCRVDVGEVGAGASIGLELSAERAPGRIVHAVAVSGGREVARAASIDERGGFELRIPGEALAPGPVEIRIGAGSPQDPVACVLTGRSKAP